MLLEYWNISSPICLHCAATVSQIFSCVFSCLVCPLEAIQKLITVVIKELVEKTGHFSLMRDSCCKGSERRTKSKETLLGFSFLWFTSKISRHLSDKDRHCLFHHLLFRPKFTVLRTETPVDYIMFLNQCQYDKRKCGYKLLCLLDKQSGFFFTHSWKVHTEVLKGKISKSNMPDEMYYPHDIVYIPMWVTANGHTDIVWCGKKKKKNLARWADGSSKLTDHNSSLPVTSFSLTWLLHSAHW